MTNEEVITEIWSESPIHGTSDQISMLIIINGPLDKIPAGNLMGDRAKLAIELVAQLLVYRREFGKTKFKHADIVEALKGAAIFRLLADCEKINGDQDDWADIVNKADVLVSPIPGSEVPVEWAAYDFDTQNEDFKNQWLHLVSQMKTAVRPIYRPNAA